ncbi:MAG: kynurenine formamidase [Planctomycetes bacterium]|nr:kynurenine formamidase [Planctomycetota bacterium]
MSIMSVVYDITPTITPDMKVWPGDTPMSREVLLDMPRGDNLTLSTLHATVHLGAHADGPNHYGAHAPSIEQRDLDFYLGPCEVMHVDVPRGTRIGLDDLPAEPSAGRVLLATGSFPDPTVWNEDFCGLEPALVDALQEQGVCLVGVDTPSVDLFQDQSLSAHQRFLAHDMAILEGLVLTGVPEGLYELIALPLKLAGFDASPVRAVLRPL